MGKGTKNSVFKGLKEILYSLYDNNGNERIEYLDPIPRLKLSEARLELLKNICDLALTTDIISDWSKLYIKDRNIKLKNVVEEVNRLNREKMTLVKVKTGKNVVYEAGGEVSYNTVTSKIEYDRKLFEAALGGSDILVDILYYPSKNIEHYQINVSKLMEKYKGSGDARKKLCLNIENSVYNKTYNGDFVEKYKDVLFTYLESTRLAIEKELNEDKEFVGYFNYLLSGIYTEDTKVQKERKDLLDLLNGISNAQILSNIQERNRLEEIDKLRGLDETDKYTSDFEYNNGIDNYEDDLILEDQAVLDTEPEENKIIVDSVEDDEDIDLGTNEVKITKVSENRIDKVEDTIEIKPETPKSRRLQF